MVRELEAATDADSGVRAAAKLWACAGVANACGAVATNPIDVVKLRVQLAGAGTASSSAGAAAALVRDKGLGGLARGLPASVVREMVYAGLRLGCYDAAATTRSRRRWLRARSAARLAARSGAPRSW